MTNVALMIRLEAKKGKEAEVERFLKEGLETVNNEQQTVSWYALRIGQGKYGIFDTFTDNRGRELHLDGEIAKALKKKTPELFSQPPTIEKIDILAAKIPELEHH